MNHCTHIQAPAESPNPDETAVVFLGEDLIETSTEKQIKAMMTHRHMRHIRVMPDCHVGHGCCIGFTAHIEAEYVVPSYVGGDIGCGILTYPLGVTKLNLERTEKKIKNIIPMGGGHLNVHSIPPIEETFMKKYLDKAQIHAALFASTHNLEPPTIDYNYFVELCHKIGMDVNASLCAFGTLGSGNHFIEINMDPDGGEFFLTIHSGSRSFGMKLFEYHNSKVDKHEKCLLGEESIQYCFDLMVAQQLAVMNRHIMLQLILRDMQIEYEEDLLVESIHNYIDFQTAASKVDESNCDENIHANILRKGSISAKADELCIVALNMRDGILICRGKGNENWNHSCAHGCGRIMSRSEARRRIKLKDYKKAMQDVVSTSVLKETLDEAPQAYKDMDITVSALDPTVTVEKHLTAVVNLKGID